MITKVTDSGKTTCETQGTTRSHSAQSSGHGTPQPAWKKLLSDPRLGRATNSKSVGSGFDSRGAHEPQFLLTRTGVSYLNNKKLPNS